MTFIVCDINIRYGCKIRHSCLSNEKGEPSPGSLIYLNMLLFMRIDLAQYCVRQTLYKSLKAFILKVASFILDTCNACIEEQHQFQGHIPPPLGSLLPPCSGTTAAYQQSDMRDITCSSSPQIRPQNVGILSRRKDWTYCVYKSFMTLKELMAMIQIIIF